MNEGAFSKEKDHRDLSPTPQHQDQSPGVESEMFPRPQYIDPNYKASGKLEGKVAIITGGDSGIGRAIAVHFAAEGANVVINYFSDNEQEDAEKTIILIHKCGREGVVYKGDVGSEDFCHSLISKTLDGFGKIDIIVNNAAQQFPQESIEDVTSLQLEQTFRTNIFSLFFMVKASLPFLKEGARIINTAPVTAYKGNGDLLDYSATKGAVISFTRSLAEQLVDRKITVNAVAPGPIWTPLIPSTFSADKVAEFGKKPL